MPRKKRTQKKKEIEEPTRGYLLHVYHRENRGKTTIYAIGKLETGETFGLVDDRDRPVFFIRVSDRARVEEHVSASPVTLEDSSWTTMDGEPVLAVACDRASVLRKLADLLNRNDDVDRLTDAQAGVLLWASQMAHHRATALEEPAARIRALRFQSLREDTVSSVQAVSDHLAIPLSSKQIENSVTREMARHAKSARPFSSQEHGEKTLAWQREYGDELADGRRWFETELGSTGLLDWPPPSLHLL